MVASRALALGALAILLAAPAAAQAPVARPDLYVTGGVGAGWAKLSCDICDDGRLRGVAGHAGFGITVPRNILLGAEINYWKGERDDVTRTLVLLGPVAYWFVGNERNLFLKGGVLYSHYTAKADGPDITGGSVGLELGTGYRFQVGRRIAVTPFFNMIATKNGKLRIDDEAVATENARLTQLQIGVGANWR